MSDDPVSDDPVEGASHQFERTAMAHWRTTFAAAVVALLIVRQSDDGVERVAAVVGALGGLLTIAAIGFVRHAALHRADARVRPFAIAGIAAALVVMEVVAVIVVV